MQFILCAISYSASIFCLVILKVNLGGEIFARISFKFFFAEYKYFYVFEALFSSHRTWRIGVAYQSISRCRTTYLRVKACHQQNIKMLHQVFKYLITKWCIICGIHFQICYFEFLMSSIYLFLYFMYIYNDHLLLVLCCYCGSFLCSERSPWIVCIICRVPDRRWFDPTKIRLNPGGIQNKHNRHL
jgi:hypothetical protein